MYVLRCPISYVLMILLVRYVPGVLGLVVVRAWARPSRCLVSISLVTSPPPRLRTHTPGRILLVVICVMVMGFTAPGLPSLGALAVVRVRMETGR